MNKAIERLRQLWTPQDEVAELFADLEPGSEVDAMVREFLHAVIQQHGPHTINLDQLNVGMLNWSIVHHEPRPGQPGRREATLWVEEA